MKSSIDEKLVKSFEGFVFELLEKISYLKHYKGRHFDCHVDFNWSFKSKKEQNVASTRSQLSQLCSKKMTRTKLRLV